MDSEDDELPPTLVDVGEAENSKDEKPIKVPITIVTGWRRHSSRNICSHGFYRISRSGQNDIDELHPD
jgi:hypothetical protein